MEQGREFFSQLPSDIQRRFREAAVSRRVSAGETIFNEGDVADGFFCLSSGRIEISSVSRTGRRTILNIMVAPDLLGEIGLLDGGLRTATAKALTTLEMHWVSRSKALVLMDEEPRIARLIAEGLMRRLRWINDQLADRTNLNVAARTAKWLLHLDNCNGMTSDGVVDVSQDDIADKVASSREYINRVLTGWRQEGLIELSRGRLRILQREKLAELT